MYLTREDVYPNPDASQYSSLWAKTSQRPPCILVTKHPLFCWFYDAALSPPLITQVPEIRHRLQKTQDVLWSFV